MPARRSDPRDSGVRARPPDPRTPGESPKGRPPPLKKLLALCVTAVFAASLGAAPARSSVILSELCDPQLNYVTDRFIEIYNTGPDTVDLSNWSVVAIANNVDVTTWPLSGTLAPDQAKVCGNTTTVAVFTVQFQNAQWGASGYFNWNGRVGDGAKLVSPSAVIVDQIVATGTLFENSDMVRNMNITDPNPASTPAEWTVTPVTLATDASPGSHNGSPVSGAGPRITDIVTDPLVPVAGAGVDVQASVVDTSGAIASVTLAWGTASAPLPNAIPMALLADSTYRTSAAIPAQSAGVTVYYRVGAVGAAANSNSPTLSYTLGGAGGGPPTVLAVGEMSDSTLLVQFSEPVEESSAEVPTNYTVGPLAGIDAARDPLQPSQVLVTFRGLAPGSQTLTVNGVADLDANVAFGATRDFYYVDVSVPAGYYDSAAGLQGSALRVALHNIIRNHVVNSYAFALTAFATTDVKPNGKIWDMYSDIPGGTPPYEYTVGQTGQGGSEGLGYNREHSFPQSWFNGASPMYSDLWILYPTDSYVNGYRANYPYGAVGVPTVTSLNGSRLGPSVSPGYTGTVFEPIDAFKGDLARSQFYVATRYFNEDAGWPGSPSASGSQLVSWAANQYVQWSTGDSVSWKERLRNGAIYVYQHNRNPFVDHPEFVAMIYDSSGTTAVGEQGVEPGIRLRPATPNPFSSRTTIGFELAASAPVSLRLYDVAGRQVRVLARGERRGAGPHALEWDGRDDSGARVEAGLYFCRLDAGSASDTRRVVRIE